MNGTDAAKYTELGFVNLSMLSERNPKDFIQMTDC